MIHKKIRLTHLDAGLYFFDAKQTETYKRYVDRCFAVKNSNPAPRVMAGFWLRQKARHYDG